MLATRLIRLCIVTAWQPDLCYTVVVVQCIRVISH